jgi:methionine-rich copper-binding protein CopC
MRALGQRLIVVAAVTLTALVCAAPGVSAHASLERSEPRADSRLAAPPAMLLLEFTQRLNPTGSWVKLIDADEKETLLQPQFDQQTQKTMRAPLESLAPGKYLVRWQSLSLDDDDYADGSFGFTVLRPDGTDPSAPQAPADQDEGSSPSTLLIAGIAVVTAAVMAFTGLRAVRRRG